MSWFWVPLLWKLVQNVCMYVVVWIQSQRKNCSTNFVENYSKSCNFCQNKFMRSYFLNHPQIRPKISIFFKSFSVGISKPSLWPSIRDIISKFGFELTHYNEQLVMRKIEIGSEVQGCASFEMKGVCLCTEAQPNC